MKVTPAKHEPDCIGIAYADPCGPRKGFWDAIPDDEWRAAAEQHDASALECWIRETAIALRTTRTPDRIEAVCYPYYRGRGIKICKRWSRKHGLGLKGPRSTGSTSTVTMNRVIAGGRLARSSRHTSGSATSAMTSPDRGGGVRHRHCSRANVLSTARHLPGVRAFTDFGTHRRRQARACTVITSTGGSAR